MMKARVPQEQKQRGAPNGDVFGGRIASVDDECERARCVVDVGGASKIEVRRGLSSRVVDVRNSQEQCGRQCTRIVATMRAKSE